MILVIGEILFDQFPQYRRLGGAPFNFAFHLMNLHMPARFVSRVGSDEAGEEILRELRALRFPINHRNLLARQMFEEAIALDPDSSAACVAVGGPT